MERTIAYGDGYAQGMTDAYARAGVNIDAGNETVERYREVTSDWRHPDQLGELGGFSGLFRLPGDGSRALVASAGFLPIRRASSCAVKRVSKARTANFAPRYQVSLNAELWIGGIATGNRIIIS